MLPTRFGNALRSFETHPRKRYGLDGIAVWPRIDMLLSDAERQTLEDAHANVAFFINSCLGFAATAVAPPDAVIAAQAGWSEKAVTDMVATYAHAVDERRLSELDAAFQTQPQTQTVEIPHGERS